MATTLAKGDSLLGNLDLHEIVNLIYKSKFQIILITLLFFSLAALYVFNISPIYVSSALIQVDSQLGSANSMQQMLGNLDSAFSSSGQATPADIEIALLKSRFILESVIQKLQLNVSVKPYYLPIIGSGYARRHQNRGLLKPLMGLRNYAWGGERLQLDEFISDDFPNEMNFKLIAHGKTYDLYTPHGKLLLQGEVGKFSESNPNKGPYLKLLINDLVANDGTRFKISVKHYEDVLMKIAQNFTIRDLGDKTKTKTGVLQLSLSGPNPTLLPQILSTIINFAVQRDIERKSAEASKTLDFLDRQLPSVRKTLEESEADLNGYRSSSGKIDINQESKIILMQLSTIEQNIAELKLKKIELLQELTPAHPYIKALSQKQVQLQKEMLSLEKKIRLLPETDQKALSLERDVKVKDQLYLLLLNKIQQLKVIKAGTLSDIRVLSQATVPIEPLPTHKYFILIVGLFLGLFVSIAQVLIRDFFKGGISDTESVEKQLELPTFSVVLHSDKQKQFNKELKRNNNQKGSFILAQSAPHDIAIEGIRSLRTMLQFHMACAKNNRISIMGASPSIGKSFIAVNLAQMLVDADKKILLIDVDIRRGEIYQYVGCDKSPGMTDLLIGKATYEQCIRHINSGFDFISNGNYQNKPTELLMTKTYNTLLDALSKKYDYIIIDTPPILAVSDAIIVAQHTATNLFVIGMGKNKLDEIQVAVQRVKKNGIQIGGLVFNDGTNLKKSHKQYNYYYSYGNS